MNTWRLLRLETHNAFMNMAVDEAIFKSRIEKLVPNTVRFYSWKPSAVSVGRFQSIENEVRLDNCRKHGVDVVRRISGGGTVYHDSEDEITYSVIANKEDLETPDIRSVYAKIYGGLAEAVGMLGLEADFGRGNVKTCPNLMVNGKKISGSAQSHKRGVVLQHGTLLVGVDLEKMFTFLRVPWGCTCMEIVNIARRRVTSIKKELGREVSMEEVTGCLVRGFQRALDIKLAEADLSSLERCLSTKLSEEKYGTGRWNFHGRGDFRI